MAWFYLKIISIVPFSLFRNPLFLPEIKIHVLLCTMIRTRKKKRWMDLLRGRRLRKFKRLWRSWWTEKWLKKSISLVDGNCSPLINYVFKENFSMKFNLSPNNQESSLVIFQLTSIRKQFSASTNFNEHLKLLH